MNIKFNWQTMKFEGLTMSDIETWERLYPGIEVYDALRNMIQWLDKVKGTKKANKRNWRKFIVNWLKRSQLRALNLI